MENNQTVINTNQLDEVIKVGDQLSSTGEDWHVVVKIDGGGMVGNTWATLSGNIPNPPHYKTECKVMLFDNYQFLRVVGIEELPKQYHYIKRLKDKPNYHEKEMI